METTFIYDSINKSIACANTHTCQEDSNTYLAKHKVGTNGVISDKFTGSWEVMTVPADNIPVELQICNGVPKSGTYSSTVVLGYMSDVGYEKAYIKY